jgi:poly-beta-1,6-N-acetyl-D-glucosamine synthase
MKHEPNFALTESPVAAHGELLNTGNSRRYLLVSPCRDEAQYLRRTLDSVALQSVSPTLWLVVDDGSTDETAAILEEYCRRLPYLRVIRRSDRGGRQVGPGVIEAFYAGLDEVRLEDFDYLCKLDMDLDLPVRYFEILMERMESNPRIGTTSGKPWFVHPKSGALVPEICGDEMSVGMTKFYRVACFKEIGGFVRQVMWDGIDCHRARMLGWIAESVDLEPVRFVHLRPQGASHKGIWTGRLRAGFGQYFMGTSPLYYLAVAVYRLPAHPALMGSVAMLWGYFRSWLKGLPRYDDPEFRIFLRSYQHACLRLGKRAATARVEAERAQFWRAHHPAEARDEAAAANKRRAELLGLEFDAVTIDAAVARCLELCQEPDSNTIITANSSHLCMMRRDPELASACRAGRLILADGMSVVWALRASGQPVPERVAGVDLMARLLAAAGEHQLRVYFLGAKHEVVSTCARRYVEHFVRRRTQSRRRGLQIAGPDSVGARERRRRAKCCGCRGSEQTWLLHGLQQMDQGQSFQPAAFPSQRPLHRRAAGNLVGGIRTEIRSRQRHGADAARKFRHALWQAGALGRRQGRRRRAADHGRRSGDVDGGGAEINPTAAHLFRKIFFVDRARDQAG